ncbi:hypothetical protein HS048_00985 [Planomonospora sp. ID91781]|uniref:hypothetical protein n=1 Tax=Planomonospora sp. ID91781 TaxID=2738135 RepID=UPI0018C35ECA|nr:hypothetical protein [Planomonospora sp. ID91781]MBG0819338.1 hypothetical protein [Planomonospora sp. ID91781]
MIAMTPVLERWSDDCPFWTAEQGEFFLTVPRFPTPEKVGAIMWALIWRSVTDDDLSITAANAPEAIETYLTSADEEAYAPGGLRVISGDVVINPGCCVGLDEWRDWLGALNGQPVDLGHDPDTWLESMGPVLRLRQDRDHLPPGELPGSSEQYLDIPRDALPGLLRSVHQDLVGFLAALRQWAQDIAPGLADQLVSAVDRRLQISDPLDV